MRNGGGAHSWSWVHAHVSQSVAAAPPEATRRRRLQALLNAGLPGQPLRRRGTGTHSSMLGASHRTTLGGRTSPEMLSCTPGIQFNPTTPARAPPPAILDAQCRMRDGRYRALELLSERAVDDACLQDNLWGPFAEGGLRTPCGRGRTTPSSSQVRLMRTSAGGAAWPSSPGGLCPLTGVTGNNGQAIAIAVGVPPLLAKCCGARADGCLVSSRAIGTTSPRTPPSRSGVRQPLQLPRHSPHEWWETVAWTRWPPHGSGHL